MRMLVAPNAFKHSLTALEAAEAIHSGIMKSGLHAELILVPLADGGDGSMQVIAKTLGARIVQTKAEDPLGREVDASWGWIAKRKTAIVELAEASGIRHLRTSELNPLIASTFGTGQVIKEALVKGAKKIYLTVGGSASVDGGMGILRALGMQCYDRGGRLISGRGPDVWCKIERVDLDPVMLQLEDVRLVILSDVTNPLLGEKGAARIFGPQKGADEKAVEQLDQYLFCLSQLIRQTTTKDVSAMECGGAAGGVSAGLHGLAGAEIRLGATEIMNMTGFFDHLQSADLVITGEGMIDDQSLQGKVPGMVAKEAAERGIRVIGMCGNCSLGRITPFSDVIVIADPEKNLEQNLAEGYKQLEHAAMNLGLSWRG